MLLVGLALVQVAGLAIHALDRMDVQRLAQARNIAFADDADLPACRINRAGAASDGGGGTAFAIDLAVASERYPAGTPLPEIPREQRRLFRVGMNFGAMLGDPELRWTEIKLYGGCRAGKCCIRFHLPEGRLAGRRLRTGADPAVAFADLPRRVPDDDR